MQQWDYWKYNEGIEAFDDIIENGEIEGGIFADFPPPKKPEGQAPPFRGVDYVYFFGDLNYRVNGVGDIGEFVKSLENPERTDFDDVVANDQLFIELQYLQKLETPIPFDAQVNLTPGQGQNVSAQCESSDGELEFSTSVTTQGQFDEQFQEKPVMKQADCNTKSVFAVGALQSFREDGITFPPTYKITASGAFKADRVPSYCDRILYSVGEFGTVVASDYYSPRDVLIGDHFPVVLEQTVLVAVVDTEKYDLCRKQALDDANLIQNYLVPKFRICKPEVLFGSIYDRFEEQQFTVENVHRQSEIGLEPDIAHIPRHIMLENSQFVVPPGKRLNLQIGCLLNHYLAGKDTVSAAADGERKEFTVPIRAIYKGEIQNVQYLNVVVDKCDSPFSNTSAEQRLARDLPRVAKYIFRLLNICAVELERGNMSTPQCTGISQLFHVLEIWRDNCVGTTEIIRSEDKMQTVLNLLSTVQQDSVPVNDEFYCNMCLYEILKQRSSHGNILPELESRIFEIYQASINREKLSFRARSEFSQIIEGGEAIPLSIHPRIVMEHLFNCVFLLNAETDQLIQMSHEQQATVLLMAACINYYASGLEHDEALFKDTIFRFWDREAFGPESELFERL